MNEEIAKFSSIALSEKLCYLKEYQSYVADVFSWLVKAMRTGEEDRVEHERLRLQKQSMRDRFHMMRATATRETATQAADSRTADILDDLDDLDRHIILLYQKAELCRSKGGVVRYPSDAQIAQAAYRARITTSRFTKQAISKRREKLRGMGLMPATKDKAKRCPDKLIDDMQGDNSRGKNQGKDKIRMKF